MALRCFSRRLHSCACFLRETNGKLNLTANFKYPMKREKEYVKPNKSRENMAVSKKNLSRNLSAQQYCYNSASDEELPVIRSPMTSRRLRDVSRNEDEESWDRRPYDNYVSADLMESESKGEIKLTKRHRDAFSPRKLRDYSRIEAHNDRSGQRLYETYVGSDLVESGSGSQMERYQDGFGTQSSSKGSHRFGRRVFVNEEVIFGVSPVSIALNVQRRKFYQLFIKKGVTGNQRLADLEKRAKKLDIPVQHLDVDELDELSGGRPHQGVCLDASRLQFLVQGMEGSVTNSFVRDGSASVEEKEESLWIFLDKIQDPMNFGAVLRSSYYFGVDRIITVPHLSCGLTPVVSKASSGAMELLNIYHTSSPIDLLQSKILQGWSVIGTASFDRAKQNVMMASKLKSVQDVVWPQRAVLIIGNEGDGVRNEFLQLCTDIVTVESGRELHPGMQSLNVSVATGILLHNLSTQRKLRRNQSVDGTDVLLANTS